MVAPAGNLGDSATWVPLHLRWEQTLRVPPLAVPDLDSVPPLDELVSVPSVALFLERAQAQRADFSSDEG